MPTRWFGGIGPVLIDVARAVATRTDERTGADHPADYWRTEHRNGDQHHDGKDDRGHWYNHLALQFTQYTRGTRAWRDFSNQRTSMDSAELATVQQRLLLNEQQTVDQIALLDERAREAQTPDEVAYSSHATLADEASLAVEREKEVTLRRTLQRRLLEVSHALRKLEQGAYGRCDACGQEINPQRLRAQPQAALCITCQTKLERGR